MEEKCRFVMSVRSLTRGPCGMQEAVSAYANLLLNLISSDVSHLAPSFQMLARNFFPRKNFNPLGTSRTLPPSSPLRVSEWCCGDRPRSNRAFTRACLRSKRGVSRSCERLSVWAVRRQFFTLFLFPPPTWVCERHFWCGTVIARERFIYTAQPPLKWGDEVMLCGNILIPLQER